MVLFYPLSRDRTVMKSSISADHTPSHLQILMNNPKLCIAKRLGSLFVFCWFVFSSSSETQTDHAVSCFATPRTLEGGYLIAQLLPAALQHGTRAHFLGFHPRLPLHDTSLDFLTDVETSASPCNAHLDKAQLLERQPRQGKIREVGKI